MTGRLIGNKAIISGAWHIDESCIRTVLISGTRSAGHNIRIAVYRVDRVSERDSACVGEYLLHIARITLRSVRDENLIITHYRPAHPEIVVSNGCAQEILTLVGRVALQRVIMRHFFNSLFHCVNERSRDTFDHITDS